MAHGFYDNRYMYFFKVQVLLIEATKNDPLRRFTKERRGML
jgi:hypothetical protein